MDCVTIPIHKGTTGLDVLSVILKRYPEYSSKNFEWGLARTEHVCTLLFFFLFFSANKYISLLEEESLLLIG